VYYVKRNTVFNGLVGVVMMAKLIFAGCNNAD
jgi:hypothetical protein